MTIHNALPRQASTEILTNGNRLEVRHLIILILVRVSVG